MHEPYSDRDDGWRGLMLSPEEIFPPLVKEWVEGGFQVVSERSCFSKRYLAERTH